MAQPVINNNGEISTLVEATLCFPVRGMPVQELLMGWKKTGFGSDKYAGFGGKVEPGETARQAASRELEEETGILAPPEGLQRVGTLTFLFPHKPEWSHLVHVFLAHRWLGQPEESAEMIPRWFDRDAVPMDRMWQDGTYWLPPVLDGRKVRGSFAFGPDNETICEWDMETWDVPPEVQR